MNAPNCPVVETNPSNRYFGPVQSGVVKEKVAPRSGALGPAPAAVTVIQGAIEGSNVNGVREMTRMIEINRTYSMISSLMQSQNDTKTIDRLADVAA